MRAPLLLEHVSSNIFEPFISKTKKGMGIGLAVSRLIVEAMWGSCGQKHNPDFDARFTPKAALGEGCVTKRY
jgi:C4-dicarboxylate-specific signal transduction histidine kinase